MPAKKRGGGGSSRSENSRTDRKHEEDLDELLQKFKTMNAHKTKTSPPGHLHQESANASLSSSEFSKDEVFFKIRVNGKRVDRSRLIAEVNARYETPTWNNFIQRHQCAEELMPKIVSGAFFDKDESGLPYAATLFAQAMAHSEALKGDTQIYLDRFLVPKLNAYLVEVGQSPVHPKSYVEYITACASKHYVPTVDVKWLGSEVGWGLFAAEPLMLFEYVGLYTGELAFLDSIEEEARKDNGYLYVFPKSDQNCGSLVTNSQAVGNHTRFINHSTKHNVFCIQMAINKIPYLVILSSGCEKDHQILWNYGSRYQLDHGHDLAPG